MEKPAFLHFAYDPTLPMDIIQDTKSANSQSYSDFAERKTNQFKQTFRKVHKNLVKAAETQERYQSRFAKHKEFSPGQFVFLHSPDADRFSRLPKRRNYIGPYRIQKKHNNVNFTILKAHDPRAKEMKVHANRLIAVPERRPNLDYLNTQVESKTLPRDYTLDAYNKPHPKFDDEDFIQDNSPTIAETRSNQDRLNTNREMGLNTPVDDTWNAYQKPPPKFDDFTEEQWLMNLNFNWSTNTTRQSRNEEIIRSLSPSSDDTEIYDFEADPSLSVENNYPGTPSTSQTVPLADNRKVTHTYNLRSTRT